MGESSDQPGGFGLATPRVWDSGQPSNTRMRPVLSLLAYLAVAFIGGALLAPWLCWLVRWAAPASTLAAKPFHRYFDRALLGVALVGIWPLLRRLGTRHPGELLRAGAPGQWRRMTRGLAIGFASLTTAALIILVARARVVGIEGSAAQMAWRLATAAGTAAVVAVVEELLFRGVVYGAMRQTWHWRTALVVSSLFYALVHFLGKTDLVGPVTWHSGLELLPQMLAPFAHWQQVMPGFLNLTLAGAILALAYERTGDLYFSIGLHAGWVFWLKAYGVVTAPAASRSFGFWGTGELVDGWLSLLVLALVPLALARLAARQEEGRSG